MAGLYAPLPTLRSHPRGGLRTDRGRRGLLLLHRSGLSPHTPCRSPGALTRVAACTLARSPNVVAAIRRLQTFRLLHACSGCFRLERIAGWGLHPLESAALSRRTPKADMSRGSRLPQLKSGDTDVIMRKSCTRAGSLPSNRATTGGSRSDRPNSAWAPAHDRSAMVLAGSAAARAAD